MRRSLPRLLLCTLALARPASAQLDTPQGVALSPSQVLQSPPGYTALDDSRLGVWAIFLSAEPGSGLYAQHVLADGSYGPGFDASARALTQRGTLVNNISAVPDGGGGASILWFGVNPQDSTSQFLALRYTHLLFGGGLAPGMPDTGIVVSSIASAGMLVSDDAGGVYVAWEELKGVSNPDIYAQHYDAAGNPLWSPLNSPTGRPVCAVVGLQRLRAMVPDAAGGAYVVWADSRSGTATPLYVARLLADDVAGSPWPANGVRVSPITNGIRIVGSSTSSTGGLWLAWRDVNVTTSFNAQHVAPDGTFLWTASGAMVATVSTPRADFVPAANGRVFVTWGGPDLRCALLDAAGVRVWTTESGGRVITAPPNGTLAFKAVTDHEGGQLLAWAFDNSGQSDVYTLHVDGAAAPWPGEPAGGDVFADSPDSEFPAGWVAPIGGGPLLTWLDAGQLRVSRLAGPTVSVPPSARGGLALAPLAPNPVRGDALRASFSAAPGEGRLALYDLAGRRAIEQPIVSTGGAQSVAIDGLAALAPGVYTVQLTIGGRSASRRVVRVR